MPCTNLPSPPSHAYRGAYLSVVGVSAAVEELVLDAAEALDCEAPPPLPPALLARRQSLRLHAEELGRASDEKPESIWLSTCLIFHWSKSDNAPSARLAAGHHDRGLRGGSDAGGRVHLLAGGADGGGRGGCGGRGRLVGVEGVRDVAAVPLRVPRRRHRRRVHL